MMTFRIGIVLLALALGAVSCGPSPQEQALTNTVNDLQGQLTDTSLDLEAAKAEVINLTTELEIAKTDLVAATTTLEATQAEADTAPSGDELTTLQSERDSLQGQLATLETRLAQTQRERDDLRAEVIESAEEIVALKQPSLEEASQLTSLEGQIADLTKQLRDAKTAVANLELNQTTSEEEPDSSIDPNNSTDLAAQVEDLQTQLAILQPRLEQTSLERDALRNELMGSAEEIADLKTQLTTQTSSAAPVISESDLATLQTRLEQTEKERDDLRAELTSSAEEIVALKRDLTAATETVAASEVVETEVTETEVTETGETASDTMAEASAGETNEVTSGTGGTVTESELAALQAKLAQTQRERDDLRAELIASAEEIVGLQQTPQIALETMTSERDSLLTQASELQGQLEELETERNDLTAQLSTLTTQVNVLNSAAAQERDALQTQVTELQEQLTALQEENEALALQLEMEQTSAVTADTDTPSTLEDATTSMTTETTTTNTSAETTTNSSNTASTLNTANTAELNAALASATKLNRTYERLLTEAKNLPSVSETQQAQLEAAQTALREAQQTVARLSEARGIHTILPGDSLSSIAVKFYGEGNDWPKVLEANKHLLGNDANLVYEGMVLVIP
jgi:chromosome segregation ATPase